MENTMTSHRPSRMSLDGLFAVSVGAALMATAPIGAASAAGVGGDSAVGSTGAGPSQAANGGGYESRRRPTAPT
jgi:hypothetical protein